MKKVMYLLLATAILLVCNPISASAATPSNDENVASEYILLWENPNPDAEPTSNQNLRYGEREVWTVIDSDEESVITRPSNQPANGYYFPSGGSIYVNTSGGPDLSVSVSLGWDDHFSISLNIGYASTSPIIGGAVVDFPASTVPRVIRIKHDYKFEYLKVDCYQGPTYTGTYYTTRTTLLTIGYILDPQPNGV